MSSRQARADTAATPANNSAPMRPNTVERHEMICVAAYYRAERRGFAPGGAEDDWIAAEAEIDRLIASMARRGITRVAYETTGLRHALRLWSQ